MDFLREIVAGPKNRYKKDGYNLDLTYITPRIIAMAYPADGIQKLYRNSIDAVSQFLQKQHNNNYQIINVSGREINSEKLSNIHSFYWEDHKTPEFQVLFIICEIMLKHLLISEDKVCVVHCNHGKGRTGTLICCFLLYTGYFSTTDEAMRFYAKQRFEKEGYGVTQPCQIQYINYFRQIMSNEKKFPSVVTLYKIQLQGDHGLRDPYFKLKSLNNDEYIFNTNSEQSETLVVKNTEYFLTRIRKRVYFVGDASLEIKHQPIMGKHIAGSFVFNTAFLNGPSCTVVVSLKEISPLSAVKSGIFSSNFKLTLFYKPICQCSKDDSFAKQCEKCSPYYGNEVQHWNQIYEILEKKPKINSKWVLFGKKVNESELGEKDKERNHTY